MAVVYTITAVDALDAGGRLSMSSFARVFTVEANESGVRVRLKVEDFETLQAGGHLPKVGDPVAASWSRAKVFSTLRYRRFQVSESAGVLTVNAQASTRYVWDPEYPIGEAAGYTWLPIVGAFVARPTNLRAYRAWNDVTYPADPNAPGTADIGGTKIDAAGQARETIIEGGELVLSTYLDTYQSKLGDSWADALQNFIGRFNSVAFLGFPIGSLLCLEYPTPHEEDEYAQVTLRFLYSPVFHLEQIPRMDADSRVITDANGNALTVRFQRIGVKPAVDFNAIWGTPGASADFRKWRAHHGLFTFTP
jgi:hypothetical protein